ncbi:MAG: ATP-binding cassette domain-containing protein [Thermoanaerobaculales bacterium]|nr:ATP-binding cassette domain-containing protein [Thermoanaerobaculales bacterium]
MINEISSHTVNSLLEKYPFAATFFDGHHVQTEGREEGTVQTLLARSVAEAGEDAITTADELLEQLTEHINQMLLFLADDLDTVRSLSILPGTHKDGSPEGFSNITINSGETICIVGPTGSGKSRLLGDIEWVAQGDTPTGRHVLLNQQVPDRKWRFSPTHKLVAQLSQNMNFVMDLTVREFLEMHAESRLIDNVGDVVMRIMDQANDLTGESFAPTTPITSLSGGQSRALMIADTAILSRSPIVLIDEIENAGIDRRKALGLLLSEDKIVLMATHDPVLALMGGRRLIIANGGIEAVIETTDTERGILEELAVMDRRMMDLRNRLRRGERLG